MPQSPSPQPLAAMEYQTLRGYIGALALSFPWVLGLGQVIYRQVHHATACLPSHYTSLSAYYRGPMRNVFVGVLVAIGVFLCSYRGLDRTWLPKWRRFKWYMPWRKRREKRGWAQEWMLGKVAGLSAIGVALFPERYPQTSTIHLLCALLLFVALARFAYLFAEEAEQAGNKTWPYKLCSWVIMLMILYCAWDHIRHEGSIALQETAAVEAFGVSWLMVSGRVEQSGQLLKSGFSYLVRTLR